VVKAKVRVHHFSMEVRDLERSSAFYEKLLGFTTEMSIQWKNERIVFLTLGHARLELVQPSAFVRSPANTHIAFEVDDLDGMCVRLAEEGIQLEEEVVIAGKGWRSVFVYGPDGELLEFLEAPAGAETDSDEAGD
jgi:lactoylglutathione lyase